MATLANLVRADFALEGLQLIDLPPSLWRIHDDIKTNLGTTNISDDDLLFYSGTFGTDFPFISSGDCNGVNKTRYARLPGIRLPYNYAAGQSVAIWCEAGMKTTVADTTATLLFEAYREDGNVIKSGTNYDNLVQGSAQSINSLTWTTKASTSTALIFQLNGYGLVPGDCLDIRATMAINDASGAGGAVIGGFRAFLALTTKG